MMWTSRRKLYRAIRQTIMDNACERSPGIVTRVSALAIYLLTANREVRFRRASAFERWPLQSERDAAKKPLCGTTRALKRSGDGPESPCRDQRPPDC